MFLGVFACTYLILGLKELEVALDMNQPVSKHITNELKLQNWYDTWHGIQNLCT